MGGHCDYHSVNGWLITVEDNGRGIPVGIHKKKEYLRLRL
jgi:DNA gyrase/topoisomerase IV subunit B